MAGADAGSRTRTGSPPAYNIQLARKRAGEIIRAVKEGKFKPDSFERVASAWRELHCQARKLRSLSDIDRQLKRMSHAWTGREFTSIGRGDVAKLLDQIESRSGLPPTACRSLVRWRIGTRRAMTTIALQS